MTRMQIRKNELIKYQEARAQERPKPETPQEIAPRFLRLGLRRTVYRHSSDPGQLVSVRLARPSCAFMSKTPRSHDVAEAPSKHLSILSGMAAIRSSPIGAFASQEGVLACPGDLARHGAARTNEFDAWQVTADDHKRGTPAGLWMPGAGVVALAVTWGAWVRLEWSHIRRFGRPSTWTAVPHRPESQPRRREGSGERALPLIMTWCPDKHAVNRWSSARVTGSWR